LPIYCNNREEYINLNNTNKDVVLRVEHLTKKYEIIHSPWRKFLYYVFNIKSGTEFWALTDVNFEVKRGETFGIIGTNGSGKSTLLQIISGIIPKTSGNVYTNGKISALLELGSGFNPESTGYENIFMNAAVLGLRKEEIGKKIDTIIHFADIGDFINEPVKTYFSGMFIRLAFAVAINVDAEIIIIDEALAVGDIFFRQKCYAKLNELKAEGKTIILVSHGMNEVEQFCDRALLLSHGKQLMLDQSGEVVQKYYMLNQGTSDQEIEEQIRQEQNGLPDTAVKPEFFEGDWTVAEDMYLDLDRSKESSSGRAHFLKAGLFDENGKSRRLFKQGEDAYFYSEIMVDENIEVPINGIVILNQKNVIVHGKNSFQTDQKLPASVRKGSIIYNCIKLCLDIEQGEYTFEMGLTALPEKIYRIRSEISHEELNKYEVVLTDRRNIGAFAVQGKKSKTPSMLNFYGLVDLNSEFDTRIKSGE
jgi:lipopolysaccharide transport system ATP-binding protein